jgi:hypothetical protein
MVTNHFGNRNFMFANGEKGQGKIGFGRKNWLGDEVTLEPITHATLRLNQSLANNNMVLYYPKNNLLLGLHQLLSMFYNLGLNQVSIWPIPITMPETIIENMFTKGLHVMNYNFPLFH